MVPTTIYIKSGINSNEVIVEFVLINCSVISSYLSKSYRNIFLFFVVANINFSFVSKQKSTTIFGSLGNLFITLPFE